MYPELFRIGNFPVNTYGVLLALAFLVALYVAARLGERDGLPRERIYDLGLWVLLAGLVGSKLLMMVVEPEYARGAVAPALARLPALGRRLVRRLHRRHRRPATS